MSALGFRVQGERLRGDHGAQLGREVEVRVQREAQRDAR